MADYLTNDTDLQSVANAIRTKTGTTGSLTYPSGFASAISGIASDCNATAGDIKTGKTALVGNTIITGNMSGKAAATYNTSSSDQTIAGGQYLSGAQTIKAVTTSNISAGNIKAGVNVKVGDANSAGRISNVTGTFTNDGTAAAGDILSGKIAYVNGNKITGNIPSLGATTYNASTSDQSISSGRYLSGAQTIRRITTSNISAGNIKKGVTIQVGDSGSATRIANVTGSCPQCNISTSVSDIFPVMFNKGVNYTGWSYGGDSSSTYAAQKTNGAYNSTGDPPYNAPFFVPSRMTWTYYPNRYAQSTSTITLEAGTWYYFKETGTTYVWGIYNGSGTKLTDFYKLVSWVYA